MAPAFKSPPHPARKPITPAIRPASSHPTEIARSGATLRSADAVRGPWTDETAQSPHQVNPTGAGKFYRLKQ
ncbi:MAG: hypothetical protein HS113_15740 [Verrucomicrobiales bacterium]|nr:hypothetical protein [Verrucomicrobiales bacterium]